ncbi:KR domain-containing protein, partial [Thioclava sp. BHET1]
VAGAQLLDRLTRGLGLRYFWLYSSISARFGNPGQSAYVVANRALEQIAEARHAAGLPALAIGWGPISDVGMLARDAATRTVLTNQLGRLLSASDALSALGRALSGGIEAGRSNLAIAPMAWARLARDLPVVAGPLFDCVPRQADAAAGDLDLHALIAAKGEGAARKAVLDVIVTEASRIMRCAPSEIDPARPFVDIGFDSLMAMNLKIAAEDRLGVDVPIRTLTEDLGPARLVQNLFDGLGAD